MQTELESDRSISEQVETQMNLLEQKIANVVSEISRIKSENSELTEERDALAEKVRLLDAKLAGIDSEEVEGKLSTLTEEIELLHHERESIARRIGELLDKLDLLSS